MNHNSLISLINLAILTTLTLPSSGCIRRAVDAFVTGPVVARGTDIPDVNKVCAMGTALSSAIAGTGSEAHPPHRALIIAETTAGLCDEASGWEAQLEQESVRKNLALGATGRIALIKDAGLKESRLRSRAAQRFYRAWQHAEAVWGPIGQGECPNIREKDEFTYLLSLFSGTVALIHDKASDSRVGVPMDMLNRVARGASCVDTEKWWHVPTALEAGAWATIPGSGPEDVEPWTLLVQEAKAGEQSGVRLAWAIYSLISGNADREAEVERAIRGHAATLASIPGDPTWLLFDEYARQVTLHESDLIWMKAAGHRTITLGELPGDEPPKEETVNPFESDPFAAEAEKGSKTNATPGLEDAPSLFEDASPGSIGTTPELEENQ